MGSFKSIMCGSRYHAVCAKRRWWVGLCKCTSIHLQVEAPQVDVKPRVVVIMKKSTVEKNLLRESRGVPACSSSQVLLRLRKQPLHKPVNHHQQRSPLCLPLASTFLLLSLQLFYPHMLSAAPNFLHLLAALPVVLYLSKVSTKHHHNLLRQLLNAYR